MTSEERSERQPGNSTDDTDSTGTAADGRYTGGQTATWSRVLVYSAATLAVLLVGATLGMLIEQNRDGGDTSITPQAGSVSVGFAQDMSAHHVQAVTMANWARDHSDDPRVVQLAFDIASTQQEQIGRMKGWLMLWGQPEQPLGEPMTWMAGPEGHAHGSGQGTGSGARGGVGAVPDGSGDEPLMPGMATMDELSRMRSLSGAELDVYFLQLMLRHHQGGTDMARYAYDHASVPAVRTLANSMLVSQGAEIDLMRQMLAEREAEPLPFP